MAAVSLDSQRQFGAEIRRLRSLWAAVERSFVLTLDTARAKNGMMPWKPHDLDQYLPGTQHEFINKLDGQYPRIFREVLFVRIVSAFEVFLSDLAREIFERQLDFLHRLYNSKAYENRKMPTSEVIRASSVAALRASAIDNIIRDIRGFNEFQTLYKDAFGIAFDNLADLAFVREFHLRRHSLVHRLGKLDSHYRDKSGDPKETLGHKLTVDREYLLQVFTTTEVLVEGLCKLAHEKVCRTSAEEPEARISIEVLVESANRVDVPYPLSDSFRFEVRDTSGIGRTVLLRDLLSDSVQDQRERRLMLKGTYAELSTYVRQIRTREKKGGFRVLSLKQLVNGIPHPFAASAPSRLSPDQLQELRQQLPANILTASSKEREAVLHELATKLKISKGECERAYEQILCTVLRRAAPVANEE